MILVASSCAGRSLEFAVEDKGDGTVLCSHEALPAGDFYLQVCT